MENNLTENHDVKIVSNSQPSKPTTPPDGGLRAWLVMFGSFLCNGIIFGTINSGGIIFAALHEILEKENVENPASQASITLSLAIGATFFLSMAAGVLTDKFGIRCITILGGIIASIGMLLSAFCFKQPLLLTFTMGLTFGVGASLTYTPSLVILGHYFSKRMGIVNGFVTAGSSIFTIIITDLLQYIVKYHDLKLAFLVLGVMMTVLIVAGIIFKPLLPKTAPAKRKVEETTCGKKCSSFWGQFINYEIWRKKKYVIWALAIPSALFGYFVPYVHLKKYANDVLNSNATISNCSETLQHIFHTNSTLQLHHALSENLPYETCNDILLEAFSDNPIIVDCAALASMAINVSSLPLSNTDIFEAVQNSSKKCLEIFTNLPFEDNTKIIIQVLGGASGVGRLVFGLVADRPWVNRILLQQISFFCIGSLTMLLTTANAMWKFIIIAFGMGLFDGCFISLLGPIAFDIVGSSGASQAIGSLLALCAIPLTLGPFIAGVMYDKLGSYVIPFLCAGVPPIIGCFALCFIRLVKEPPKSDYLCDDIPQKINDTNHSEPESVALMNDKKVNMTDPTKDDEKKVKLIKKESSL